jgi:hypothetical protein
VVRRTGGEPPAPRRQEDARLLGGPGPRLPRADLERFENALPNQRTIELPDANHFFFEDVADRMVSEIATFISKDGDVADHR